MDHNSDDSYDEMLLEPLILINDGEEESESKSEETFNQTNLDSIPLIGPDVSIIPIKRKAPLFKIKLCEKKLGKYQKHSLSSKEDTPVKSSPRGPRTNVKIITKEEAEHIPETYQKRKSAPLEKCPICKKFFRRMATHLLKHQYLMDPYMELNEGFFCNFCSRTFNTHSNFAIHLRTHTGQKPYVCETCGKAFSQSCNLVNHMRIHSGEKPYKCPHCDKAFTQSGNLNNHIRLHTNEKPFKCHFCDKAFVQSGNLNSHIKNNHGVRLSAEMKLNNTI